MRHLWPSSLLKRFWHAGKEVQCPIVQGSEVMVKLFAQHTSLVTWLTPTHLQFQFITITTMNPPQKKSLLGTIWCFCVCDPLHLVCLSPFSFPFLMGLFGLSLCQESAPHWDLCFPGSWNPLQWSVLTSAAWGLRQRAGGSTYQHLLWEKVHRRAFYSLVSGTRYQQGEREGVRSETTCWNLVFAVWSITAMLAS